MSHDKIKAAIRGRMACTGEPHTVARRAVLDAGGHRGRWFAISYRNAGVDRVTALLDGLLGAGPGRTGVELDPDELRLRMGRWRQRIRARQSAPRTASSWTPNGTTGVHVTNGRLLVNGGASGSWSSRWIRRAGLTGR